MKVIHIIGCAILISNKKNCSDQQVQRSPNLNRNKIDKSLNEVFQQRN